MHRILMVVSGSMVLGGTETMIMNWYRNFDRNKVQVDFVCYGKSVGEYDDEIIKSGGNIYRLPSKRENLIKNIFGLFQICKNNKYKIIHVHMDAMSFFPLLIAKYAGVKVRICHCHSTQHLYRSKIDFYLKCIITKLIPFIATDLFACSNASGNWLYGNKPYTVIKNAVDVNKFEYTKDKEDIAKGMLNINEEFVIGNVGNLNYPKNHMFLLKVFSEIKKLNQNTKLVIIGDGADVKDLITEMDKLKIKDNVLLLGRRNDVDKLIHAFNVFVLPSIFEGLPVVLIEAQAAGIPCVVSDTVTSEVAVTDLITFYSLENNETKWAIKIINESKNGKRNYSDKLKERGYDVKTESGILQNYYLRKIDEI